VSYDRYQYLWPPRPESKIPPTMIGFYDKRNWYAQAKLNGTCTLIFTDGTEVIIKTRHGEDHKAWKPRQEHLDFFKSTARAGKWMVFPLKEDNKQLELI